MAESSTTAVPSTAPGNMTELGSTQQLIDVARVTYEDGPARGGTGLIIRNPAGFSVELMIDRALDIGWADAAGVPLAWRSPLGRVAGTRHEPHGGGWAQTFGGGLLATCGLSSTGAPSDIDGIHYGLHGRVGHLPAQQVTWNLEDTDEIGPAIVVRGTMVEAALGQPTLVLNRTVQLSTSRPILRVVDRVSNESYSPAGHMFRHHYNFGYPLVSGDAEILVNSAKHINRDSGNTVPEQLRLPLEVATETVPEQVWSCFPEQDSELEANLTNREGSTKLSVRYGGSGFDRLLVWRNASPGINVLGIEPSTSDDDGRLAAAQKGDLIWLAPGESRSYFSEVEFKN